MATRVLRVFHSAVVPDFRERERLLAAEHGYDVRLVVPPRWHEGSTLVEAPAAPDASLEVVRVHGRMHPILFWYDTRRLTRIVRTFKPDVVDIHEEPYSLAAAHVTRIVRRELGPTPICIYAAQNLPRRLPPPFAALNRWMLGQAAACYPCSDGAADVVRARGFAGRVRVIPLGVSIPPGELAAAQPGRIGVVGSLEPWKGVDVAIEALARLRTPDTVLRIVGDGPERQKLESLCVELGVADRVEFVGSVSQAEALQEIAAMDVLVVPSVTMKRRSEQFGRVAAQGLAAGAAVIVSTCGALPSLVGDAGIVVPERDAEALAHALAALLADPVRRSELRAAGRHRAVSEFSWAAVAARFDQMYKDVLGGA